MKAVLYGTYPACELPRLRKYLRSQWELAAIRDEAPVGEKAAALADATVLITSKYTAGDPPVPKLHFLQCASTGTENLDFSRLPSDCRVCNAYGHESGIAEYVLWAILDWSVQCRSIPPFLATGTWSVDEWVSVPNHGEASAKTVGIVGFGHIGREVARRARALGMKVVALSAWRSGWHHRNLADRSFTVDEADDFLARSDFIVVCCPLLPETRGMIDARWFAAMRQSAVLIQVGRGPVIDEQSFYAALERRTIRGATIDVWYEYPGPAGGRVPFARFPFHKLPNVVMTPHISARSEEAWDRRFRQIASNLDAFASGGALLNVMERRLKNPTSPAKRRLPLKDSV